MNNSTIDRAALVEAQLRSYGFTDVDLIRLTPRDQEDQLQMVLTEPHRYNVAL
jgi:hypothetical protein